MLGNNSVTQASRALRLAAAAFTALVSAEAATAEPLKEPPVFQSHRRSLDIVMVARAKPVAAANGATGWVYAICERDYPRQNDCPDNAWTASSYGGVRLALQPGDLLNIRFVNSLPKILDSDHAKDPHHAYLALNPTNLHTHGLIVEPRYPSFGNPTFGDNVFVSAFNTANGAPPAGTRDRRTGLNLDMHGSVIARNIVDYSIQIPRNHPLGSFFFHPHIHGIALNQMSMGLSGIITIGKAGDYAHANRDDWAFSDGNVRHLILKDMQVLRNNVALSQQDPDFCDQTQAARQGDCPGAGAYAGGKWVYTVNGQKFPDARITSPEGEIWRLTNASGNVTYNLQIADQSGRVLTTQLLSVDGVTISLPSDTPPDTIVKLAGGRFKVRPCPNALAQNDVLPACVTEMVMMPSARAEIWVAYRDAAGNVATSPNATFILKQRKLQMGTGDTWPAVDLASVTFRQWSWPLHADKHIRVNSGDALKGFRSVGIFRERVHYADRSPLPAGCAALPQGHKRRIFFGLADLNDPSTFGLGYEQVDQNGRVVTKQDVKQFDPANPFVCLPLAQGQKPAQETWELVNLATENHNFHIHQTKFYQLTSSNANPDIKGAGVLQDNLPLPVATPKIDISKQNDVCTMDQWHQGKCVSTPVVVSIPFSQIGDFVYHCHILEHEDGGMMAKIKVVAAPR